jgi:hypothetical protein
MSTLTTTHTLTLMSMHTHSHTHSTPPQARCLRSLSMSHYQPLLCRHIHRLRRYPAYRSPCPTTLPTQSPRNIKAGPRASRAAPELHHPPASARSRHPSPRVRPRRAPRRPPTSCSRHKACPQTTPAPRRPPVLPYPPRMNQSLNATHLPAIAPSPTRCWLLLATSSLLGLRAPSLSPFMPPSQSHRLLTRSVTLQRHGRPNSLNSSVPPATPPIQLSRSAMVSSGLAATDARSGTTTPVPASAASGRSGR